MTENRHLKTELISLFTVCLFCILVIGITYNLNKEEIEQNQRQHTLRMVTEVMPLAYNNDLLSDQLEITDAAALESTAPVNVYRARENGQPVGLVFMPVVTSGYSGPIELAIGVSYDGVLTGVRVFKHQETDGLGSRIDQSESKWIFNFEQRSLDNTPGPAWAVKKDGGEFDHLSGATISSRAVINSVKSALDYYRLNRDKLY